MDDNPDLARLFNALDRDAWIELALILGGTFVLIRAEQWALPWLANRLHGRARHYLLASVPLLRLVLIVVALDLALPIIVEPSLRNMVALLGAAGLAIGFALKDYASSLIAGVVAAFEQPYRPGDWIELDGHYGEVVHVGMRTVALVTADDDFITVPTSSCGPARCATPTTAARCCSARRRSTSPPTTTRAWRARCSRTSP